MNYLDLIILIILFISGIKGYRKGFIHQFVFLAALILGIFIAVKFTKLVSPYIQSHFIESVNTSKITAFIVLFVLVIICIHWLGKYLEKTFEEVELGHLNKIVGILFAISKTIFLISVFMVLLRFSIINLNWPSTRDIDESFSYKPIESVAPAVFPYLKLSKDNNTTQYPYKKNNP
jgi:membrane protein required for colicin V production